MKYLLLALTFMVPLIPGSLDSTAALHRGGKAIVYVGTFRGQASKGIYAWRFDGDSGKMEPLGLVAETSRPLFLALHPNRRFLYAVSRPSPVDRKNIGVVLAYSIDGQTGKLTALNSLPSRGIDPAYVSVDRTGNNVLVSNYGSNSGEGNVAVFPIRKDGSLADASDFIQYSGRGVHPQRQQGPHSHAIDAAPDNRFVIVTDLGLDKLFLYRFDPSKGKLNANNPPFIALQPGAGPRHLVFHPGGRFVYVVNEIQSTITTFAYDPAAGALKELQTIATLPKDFSGASSAAEVRVHPNGKFLYSLNRGHDSIAVFSIDAKTGMLTLIELTPTEGKTASNFSIEPGGSWLIAANQGSDTLVLFRLDPNTGKLQATGQGFEVGAPSCVSFLPLPEIRGQESEIRGQKTVRGQKSEVRSQRSEVRDQRSEIRGQTSEVRS
jgi:6-phosphogluconolactonase